PALGQRVCFVDNASTLLSWRFKYLLCGANVGGPVTLNDDRRTPTRFYGERFLHYQFLDVVFTKPLYRAEHMFAIGAVAHSETCSSWGFSTRLQKNRLFEPKCGHPLQRQGLSWRRVGRWNQLSKSALCIELTPQLERDKMSVSGKTVFSQRVRPEELI